MFRRSHVDTIRARIEEPRRFIQIVIGPRQVGKSTAIRQALEGLDMPFVFARADAATPPSRAWLRGQWVQARSLIGDGRPAALLVIDEVQKIREWSSEVKDLWDEDAFDGTDLRVVLCGSSSLLLQKGPSESLRGRFELIRMPHWTFAECREAFGYTLDEFLLYGGYPGAAALRADPDRWLAYMNDSIIDSALINDILMLEEVKKPALLSALFRLGITFSGQEVSYRKLMGQLDDAGNATTIAHYLQLLGRANLLAALPKYGDKEIAVRNSTPRLMAYDTSLITASVSSDHLDLINDTARRGHMVESAVGAYLLGRSASQRFKVFWWRERNAECDFVVCSDKDIIAIEVKSGAHANLVGMTEFLTTHPKAKRIVVGPKDSSIIDFLTGVIL